MKKMTLFLIAVIAVAAFFRLWSITSVPPGLYPDEAMNGNNALEALHTGQWKIFYAENNGREGLFINIIALSIKIFGNKPWAVRLPSAIFGVLTVVGIYFLTRELLEKNGRIALLASFLLAASFWHINFSRIGFRAIMAPFFSIWAFYFLWRIFRENSSNRSKIFSSIASGVFFGLGFYSYLAYRIMPLILVIPFIKSWRMPSFRRDFLIFVAVALLIALPLGIYFLKNPQDFIGRTSQVSIASYASPLQDLGNNILKTTGMFWTKGDYNWRHNFSGAPQLWWPVGILFALGIIITVKRANQSANIFLIFWLFLGLLPAVISNEGVPHALRSILTIPPVMIISALGLEWVINLIQNWLLRQKAKWNQCQHQVNRIEKELIFLLFIFLAAIAVNSYNQYFFRWAPNINVYYAFNQNYVEIGNSLNNLPRELPKYVIINASGALVKDIPMPAQTVMFITKTYLPEQQKEKNIYYVTMENLGKFIEETAKKENFILAALEIDASLIKTLKEKIPGLRFENRDGVLIGLNE